MMLIRLFSLFLAAFSSAVMMNTSSPSPVNKYPNFLALSYLSNSSSNNNTFPSNISLGELMIQACSSQAESTFEQRKAPPGVIACCQALTLVDCMVYQCKSLSSPPPITKDEDEKGEKSTADHNLIPECSHLRLAALHVSMDALCQMMNVRNLSLVECANLAQTANLGLVAALMLSAFLLITTLCGLYMWAQNKLRSRRKGQGGETKAVASGTALTPRPPDKGKVIKSAGAGKTKKKASSYSPFLGKRRSSVKSKKTMKSVKELKRGSSVGSKLVSPLKRNSLSKIKLAAKSSNSVLKKIKKQ